MLFIFCIYEIKICIYDKWLISIVLVLSNLITIDMLLDEFYKFYYYKFMRFTI